MSSNQLLSPIENKLFAGIALLICCLYFTNLTNKIVNGYNQSVRNAETARMETANGSEQISFGVYCFPAMRDYETILAFQILLVPVLFGCLLSRKTGSFVFSTLLAAFALFGYFQWFFRTFSAIKANRTFNLENTGLNGFLFYDSTTLDGDLFLAFASLFVLQIFVLTRFILNKFAGQNHLS